MILVIDVFLWWKHACLVVVILRFFFIRNCSCPSICFLQIPQGSDKAESVDQMEILFRGKESCWSLFSSVPSLFCLVIECFWWQMLAKFVERRESNQKLASLSTVWLTSCSWIVARIFLYTSDDPRTTRFCPEQALEIWNATADDWNLQQPFSYLFLRKKCYNLFKHICF